MTAPRAFAALLAACCACAAFAAGTAAETLSGSRLALPVVTSSRDGLLAQRVIEREWGLSEDSTYAEVDVEGFKSEGGAMALSALVPGAGHLYLGEGSGWAYLLVETAGWIGQRLSARDADRSADQMAAFVGSPYDTTAGWTLERFEAHGGSDSDYLLRLWAGDREAYYRELATNPSYLGGFATANPSNELSRFVSLRSDRDSRLRLAGRLETLLWLNHLVAAIDAFRTARIHNLPLRQQYQLRLGQKIRHGRPEFRAALVRRF